MGKEGKALEALMGRTDGPVFVQRCALGEDVGGRGKRLRRRGLGGSRQGGSLMLKDAQLGRAKMCKRKLMTYSSPAAG